MVNVQLFSTSKGKYAPPTDAVNAAGAPAYALSSRHQLAQYAATGCLHATFYAGAEAQLATVAALCEELDSGFIARTAVYARERGFMKDMPALLVAILAGRGAPELAPAFRRVINNGKMLRNVVQVLRSGAVGRKSLGSRPKKLVQDWLNTASEPQLLAASVGQSPSLADVVKMVHPKPAEAWRAAFFAWLIGRPHDGAQLPPAVQAFEAYKRDRGQPLPDVPFQMLSALELGAQEWAQVALQGSWQMVRQNLNTVARHGVFELEGMTGLVAAKLKDPMRLAKAKVFPYQLMAACKAASPEVPAAVREALQDALEMSLAAVPAIAGRVVVCPDVSGSMSAPVSGQRGSASSNMRCIDVAALVAAAMLRKNPDALVLPFERDVVPCSVNADDRVLDNAAKLAALGGGGTSCSAPLAWLNSRRERADLVVFVSDNESWVDARGRASETMRQWEMFKRRNPQARMVCIDCAPNASTQAQERDDVLNVGGFSDEVFRIVAAFAAGATRAGHWVAEIEAIDLDGR
ncbi:RNA-binding protein [Massilia sp. G4R7]|uniref:RNA-binding protein n=1 Tax=Massilia phyllostachyos TaxID=2898585 RepID=A0ABS8QD51_9BURK|nr:RNA-binding protein [Massilia phyllostachyos]MCD2519683.1 RNA-binding protein [Massilia phyllostachyos]